MINASRTENCFKLPLLFEEEHIFSSVSTPKRNPYKVDQINSEFTSDDFST